MSILVPCAQQKDRDELKKLENIYFTDFDGLVLERILAGLEDTFPQEYQPENYLPFLHEVADRHNITKLLNTCDYPGCIYAGALGKERNIPVPNLETILLCQHKYYARCAQKKYVPEATPNFAIVRHDHLNEVQHLSFPIFIKPVKSYLSVFAKRIDSLEELKNYLNRVMISEQFLLPFNWALSRYTDYEFDGSYFIAEELLKGEQVTLEGYVFNAKIGLIGIVDSIMIPDTISFERFVYPSFFPALVQEKMFEFSKKFVSGIGLDNSLFNIEFMYNRQSGDIKIIEINPRMSGQFSDLFKSVNGVSSYEILYNIVRGIHPIPKKEGKFKVAASLVQRQLQNMKVKSVPTQQQVKKAKKKYPELQYYPWVHAGAQLSDVLQDGVSYVYCILHLAAQDRQELQEKYDDCKVLLPFEFDPVR